MDSKIEEIDIKEKFKELNLSFPDGLVFFPENIESANAVDDFIFAEPLTQLRKVFKANNIDFTTLGNETTKLRARKSADIYLPSLFIGLNLISQNPAAVSVALSVLANYVTDFFKGTVGSKKVSLDIYVETTNKKTITKINYKGDAEGLKNIGNIIEQLK